MSPFTLVGRSSSHYTRAVQIFARELGVPYTLQPVLDIKSMDMATFAGNPAMKVPVLVDERGSLFGTENICREVLSRSGKRTSVVMRGDVADRRVANAEEMVLHVMGSEVLVIMAKMTGDAPPPKVARSIENSLRYLDANVDDLLAALPRERALSFVEVTLFCTLTHLAFRAVADVTPWARLGAFAKSFGERESARATEYRFDAA